MADELSNYKLQLQQVEVALLTDPDNTELLKLKEDIEQLVDLQQELIKTQDSESRKYVEPSNSDRATNSGQYYKEQKAKNQTLKIWKVGEKCMARDTTNGQYYEATIESISNEGEAQVIFDAYQNRGQSNVKDLKEFKQRIEVFSSTSNKRPKAARPNHKEYLKKKKLKKQARLAELEEEREKEKNKWLNFNSKASKKQIVKQQSIFQSPDSVNGRVGIGTLGKTDVQLPNNFQTARLDIHKRKM
ncbi:unnamed protein product [Chironomus riparius]|uniref:Tudor domain-containing protein n=1 Tax=Chironomus riparius TaxID=315576 RepID=A0A9N9WR43_9DIPT|nr:unnamed protein product [Chironomus riparius]